MRAFTSYCDIPFTADPLRLFEALTGDRRDVVLLESAPGEPSSHRSLLFPRNLLRLEARGGRVDVYALTGYGFDAVSALVPQLRHLGEVLKTPFGMTITLPDTGRATGEEERLRAPSTADVLRAVAFGFEREGDTAEPLHLPGLFAYDYIRRFEDIGTMRDASADAFPDYVFYLPEECIIVDHLAKTARVTVHRYGPASVGELHRGLATTIADLARDLPAAEPIPPEGDTLAPTPPPPAAVVDVNDDAFADVVRTCQRHIEAGDVFQIVPSRTFSLSCPETLVAYRALRRANPSPYLFLLRTGGEQPFDLFGASPEACVRVRGTDPRTVELHPIAGTRPRGRHADGSLDRDLDNRLEAELKLDAKEQAEHMMLVDLARNDVARVSRPGTRYVERLLGVEKYSRVMHLVSVVRGELRDDLDALHAYIATMNMGTLTGAPKLEAMRILDRLEASARGPYGGAIGYLRSDGEMDTAIVIRAALVREGTAAVRAGAGIVRDSMPQAEADETRHKAAAVLRAIAAAAEYAREVTV